MVFDALLEGGYVDDATAGFGAVVDANQGLGFEPGFREQGEALAGGPVFEHLVSLGVPGVACFEPFGEEFSQFGLQRVDERNGWGARGHVLERVLLELEEVEVVAAGLNGGSLGQRGGGGDEDGESGGQGEGFLGAGEEEVDAEVVEAVGQGG